MSPVGYLTESNGVPSSTRLGFLGTLLIVFGVWAFVCIYAVMHSTTDAVLKDVLVDLPWNVVTVIGILGGVKMYNKSREDPPPKGSDTPPAEGVQ